MPDLDPAYAELHCLSNFSFLEGASHPEELVRQAFALGYTALALTDDCSLAGVVRAHVVASELGLKLIIPLAQTSAPSKCLFRKDLNPRVYINSSCDIMGS